MQAEKRPTYLPLEMGGFILRCFGCIGSSTADAPCGTQKAAWLACYALSAADAFFLASSCA